MTIVVRLLKSGSPALAGAALATLLLFGPPIAGAFAAEVPFQMLDADRCFMFSALVPYKTESNKVEELPLELVINDQHDYETLFDPKIMRQSCAGIDRAEAIPKVDFSKQSVLGLWASGSCAATGIKKKVWRDDGQKSIIYSVWVIEAALRCQGPGYESLNLIAIPKIPAGYKVSFETIHQ
jgi:hypothetical protein